MQIRSWILEISIGGWWLFSREITEENWEKPHKLMEGERRRHLKTRKETRRRSLGEVKVSSDRSVRFLPGIDYGNRACLCFFESRKISRVHVASTRLFMKSSQLGRQLNIDDEAWRDEGKLDSTWNSLLLSLRSVTRNSKWKRTKTLQQSFDIMTVVIYWTKLWRFCD